MDKSDGHLTSPALEQETVSDSAVGRTGRPDGAVQARLQAVIMAARYYGVELDPGEFPERDRPEPPSVSALSRWVQEAGMWSRAVRLRWRHLMRLRDGGPVVLLFKDGTAGLLVGCNIEHKIVLIRDPHGPEGEPPVPVDELRLSEVWAGECLLLRSQRGQQEADEPFSFRWLAKLVLLEKKSLRDLSWASIAISFLTIIPPMMVMIVVDKVLVYQSYSTLVLLASILAIMTFYEAFLGYARRLVIIYIATRVDTRIHLHMFHRLVRLSLDYFERHPGGETMHKVNELYKVRSFLTGKLLTTFLDMFTLVFLLPVLFFMQPTLAWLSVVGACLIMMIILVFLRPLRIAMRRVVYAEVNKAAVLAETIYGVKTVKSMALEPQRRAMWDERVADVGVWRVAFGKLANWPQTLITPIENFMYVGVIMIGTYLALSGTAGMSAGVLFGFMMLSRRVSSPLVGLARLIEDYEEARASIGEAASVLNRPMEANAASGGLRPKLSGAISFEDVTFTYPNTKTPALERVAFSVPPGTMLGLVGRSGSGKSTITRLLQGINRDYSGYVKLDGNDLREINLRHLRQSFGVVLQENFLFRGSIRDNIIAGRPGLTLEDVVRAARLAGAEEFIERMPQGYETYIEEGSPNLSGGQRQRLAIARALITDPRILLLDEATSALDPESEALVNANLKRIGSGRTMVVVSHRLSSLVDCDQILVLDKGRVMDIGPHRELVERCSVYRQLWLQQNRHLESQGTRHAALAPTLVQGD